MDKKVIVVGASGVGAACVRSFAAAGASVVSLDLSRELGAAVAEAAGQRFIRCDATDCDQVFSAVDGPADGLGVATGQVVHKARRLIGGRPARAEWLRAVLQCSSQVSRALVRWSLLVQATA